MYEEKKRKERSAFLTKKMTHLHGSWDSFIHLDFFYKLYKFFLMNFIKTTTKNSQYTQGGSTSSNGDGQSVNQMSFFIKKSIRW